MTLLERIEPKYLSELKQAEKTYEHSIGNILKVLDKTATPLDLTVSEVNFLIIHTSVAPELNISAIFDLFPPIK